MATDAAEKNYFIRPDYQTLSPHQDDDGAPGEFWNSDHLETAALYQFDVYRYARSLADQRNLHRVCDVGCGPGTKLFELFDESFQLNGIDRPDAVTLADANPRDGRFFVEDFDAPKLDYLAELGPLDLIICCDVVEHLEYPDRLLEVIRTIARPETWIILSTPERTALHGPNRLSPANRFHVREWSKPEFAQFVAASGFRIEDHRMFYPFRLRPNVMSVRYCLGQILGRRSLRCCQAVLCQLAD